MKEKQEKQRQWERKQAEKLQKVNRYVPCLQIKVDDIAVKF